MIKQNSNSTPVQDNTTPPSGFHLEHDIVSEETWEALRKWMEHDLSTTTSWQHGEETQSRKIVQFGFHYDYHQETVTFPPNVPPIPHILKDLLLDPAVSSLSKEECDNFSQCIINWYEAGVEIPWHKDHEGFGSTILVYTFGEARPLLFRRQKNDGDQREMGEGSRAAFSAIPRHGSRYILSGPARYEWEHSVAKGKSRRISITFRTASTKGPVTVST